MRVSGGSESQALITLARSEVIRPFSSSNAPDFVSPHTGTVVRIWRVARRGWGGETGGRGSDFRRLAKTGA